MHTQHTHPLVATLHGIRRHLISAAACALGIGCAIWGGQAAFADTITVTTPDDAIAVDGHCSLREAITAANTDSTSGDCVAGNGADTVVVPAGVYTLTLTDSADDVNLSGDLDITDTLVISGAGAAETVIDANGIDRAIHSTYGAFTVTLAGVSIQHGLASTAGGALFQSNAIVSGSVFFSNTAFYGPGGAEFLRDSIVSQTVFKKNVSTDGMAGGATFGGRASLDHADFISNTARSGAGGALFWSEGSSLVDSTFSGNVSLEYLFTDCPGIRAALCVKGPVNRRAGIDYPIGSAGGAVFLSAADVTRTSFVSNTSPATGGVGFYGPVLLVDSTIRDNASQFGYYEEHFFEVGGAYFASTSTVSGSDFSGNTAVTVVGGATFMLTTSVTNSSFHSNTAMYAIGGALFVSDATLRATRFTSNTAGQGVGGAYFAAFVGGDVTQAQLVDSQFVGNATQNIDLGPVAAKGPSLLASGLKKQGAANDPGDSWAGGAVFLVPASVTNTVFYSNTSSGVGGAVFVTTTSILNSSFQDNTSLGIGANFLGANGGGADFHGPATVSATSFERNASAIGAGGASFDQEARVTGARFISNTTQGGNGGGASFEGPASVADSSFAGNRAQRGGGATFAQTSTVTGSLFISNTAGTIAGGAYFSADARVATSGFRGNSGDTYGGAMFARAADVSNSDFTDNIAQASAAGGACFCDIANVNATRFEGNRSGDMAGGALFVLTATLRGSQFISNTGLTGGGAYFLSYADLAGTQFVSNSATLLGGGGAHFDNGADIENVRFVGNRAKGSGGGANFLASARITNTVFLNNHAGLDGGGAQVSGGNLSWWWWSTARGSVSIVNSLFGGNTAQSNGAGLYIHDTAEASLVHVTIASPRMEPNQALAVHAGTVYLTNTLIASHSIGIDRTAGSVTEDYSLFAGVPTPRFGTVGGGAHSRIGNAEFVDPANDNYHLSARSDALNGGIDTGIHQDIDGQPRVQGHGRGSDIGFDEFLQWIQILTMVSKN